jgi:hypothetical protein
MNDSVSILVDKSALSQNALLGINLDTLKSPNIVELSLDRLDDQLTILSGLQGQVINLLSPETFSLYRGKLYQLLAGNANITPMPSRNELPRWTFISENVNLSTSSKIGLSTYIGPNTSISANVKIGNFCWLGEGVVIGSGTVIANNVTIHDGVHVGPGVKINKFNEIRKNVEANKDLIAGSIETDFFDSVAYFNGI